MYVIRKRIRVSPEKAIFMFVKNVLPPTGMSIIPEPNDLSHQQGHFIQHAVLQC